MDLARRLELLGYGTLWIPESVASDPFVLAAFVAARTERIVLATGIANIYARDPMATKAAAKTLAAAAPGRFVLGLGVSSPKLVNDVRGHVYEKPVPAMRAYLDAMEKALYRGPEPDRDAPIVLAALGPLMLALARDRTAGAFPYLVTPEHTRGARAILGVDRWLCVEQMVVDQSDAVLAREIGRRAVSSYLTAPGYRSNLERLGFSVEEMDAKSDRLVDALVAWGGYEPIERAHRRALRGRRRSRLRSAVPRATAGRGSTSTCSSGWLRATRVGVRSKAPRPPVARAMSPLRINLWSGPRNVSTALMYSFAQRADTRVVDEPLYAHYLRVSGADHPGREEVLAALDQDGERVVREVILGPLRPCGALLQADGASPGRARSLVPRALRQRAPHPRPARHAALARRAICPSADAARHRARDARRALRRAARAWDRIRRCSTRASCCSIRARCCASSAAGSGSNSTRRCCLEGGAAAGGRRLGAALVRRRAPIDRVRAVSPERERPCPSEREPLLAECLPHYERLLSRDPAQSAAERAPRASF